MKYVVTDLGAEPLAQKEKMKTLQPLKVWVSHPLVNNAFVINCYCLIIIIIISVISSDPPCKDGSSRFTRLPLKALSDQVCEIEYHFVKFQNNWRLILTAS